MPDPTHWLETVALLVVALAPPFLLAYLIYRADRWERESPRSLLLCLVLGATLLLPALWLEKTATHWLHLSPFLLRDLLLSVIGIALVEEGLKMAALLIYPYRQAFFKEPLDGIVYAVVISMGLAAIENTWYAFEYGWEVITMRALTAVPAHGIFAIFQGYYIGRAHFEEGRERHLLWRALLTSVGLHALYNFLFLQQAYDWLLLLAAPLMGLTVWLARDLVSRHQQDSQSRH